VSSHQPWTTSVKPYEDGYRIWAKAYGMDSWAGPRLQRGTAGSGKTFNKPFVGADKAEVEQNAKELEKYLNEYEANRSRRGKRRR
jgi:hypothetical protein